VLGSPCHDASLIDDRHLFAASCVPICGATRDRSLPTRQHSV